MKLKYYISGVVVTSFLSIASVSCSKDYLDQAPLTDISAETASTSEIGAEAAVTGLARQMQTQYSGLKNSNLNASGEQFFANLYGEGLGPDAIIGEIMNYGNSSTNPSNFRTLNGWWARWMYNYCYSIIGLANSILDNISEEPVESNEYWLKGSALAMRAHAYTRLLQVYAPRWTDSNNGTAMCLVLRIHAGEGNDHPFNTMGEVMDQMYGDLTEAIHCFEKTEKKRGDNLFYVDESIARGLLARLALIKNDYPTAQKMAHDARQGYRIMTGEEYLQGFSVTNDEWMWAPAMDPLGVYYWGFGPHYACNGHYVKSWGYSCTMDYGLYRQMKSTDIRAQLYFGPLCVQYEPEIAKKYGITENDFFDTENVVSQQKTQVSITGAGTSPKGKNADMWNFIKAYGKRFANIRPEDLKGIYPTNTKGLAMGVQYKFQGLDDGYTSCWPPYMRAAEMLLIEAEAACMNNDENTAKSCLSELMAKRDPSYSFSGSGAALLEEVKLQRRIELWGEGFNWFDFKRWNVPFEWKAFDAKNLENCGSFPNETAREFAVDYMRGWRAAIPQAEFTYNKLVSTADVGL